MPTRRRQPPRWPLPAALRPSLCTRRRARRGAIPICRASTRTTTSTPRRSSGRTNSRARPSRTSRRGDRRIRPGYRADVAALPGPARPRLVVARESRPHETQPAVARRRSRRRRIPPLTAEARERRAGPRASSFGGGPFDSPADFSLLERCITPRFPRLDDARRCTATSTRSCRRPGYVAITYEIIHEARVIPLDGRPHVGASDPRAHGRRARPLGRRHARRRDDELHAADAVSQRNPER